MRLAVAVATADEASECIAEAVANGPGPVNEVTIISVTHIPLVLHFGVQTGMFTPKQIEDAAVCRATKVAVVALQMLPASVRGSYILCQGWRDPAIRAHLLRWRYDELIVARRRLRTRGIPVHSAVRGTGVLVRAAHG